jgi:mannose-P-dolichol utilization defect protein 1
MANVIANGLGYLVGAGSLFLYTPIAIRICRQRSANGLTLSTWWIKVVSYTCSDVYGYANGYNLSTYAETVIILVEAAVVLVLVAYFQKKLFHRTFAIPLAVYLAFTLVAVAGAAPMFLIAVGQAGSVILNAAAIVPQLQLNQKHQSSGDYSPITAALASAGCLIRLFTTVTLNNSDPLLLSGYAIALFINVILLGQIIYYGVYAEGKTVLAVLTADVSSSTESDSDLSILVGDEEESGTNFFLGPS